MRTNSWDCRDGDYFLGKKFKQLLNSCGDKRFGLWTVCTKFIRLGADLTLSEKMKCIRCGLDFNAKSRKESFCPDCLKMIKHENKTMNIGKLRIYTIAIWFGAIAFIIWLAETFR